MTDSCGNSKDWRTGPKDLAAHRKARAVECQKVWKPRYVVRRVAVTVVGKVMENESEVGGSGLECSRWQWMSTAAGQIQLYFIKMHLLVNCNKKLFVHTTKSEGEANPIQHSTCLTENRTCKQCEETFCLNYLESRIPVALALLISAFEFRPNSSILGVSKSLLSPKCPISSNGIIPGSFFRLHQTMTARKTAYFGPF